MMMQIEEPNLQYENERIFSDYLSRQVIKDPYTFSFDLDVFRSQSPTTTQDIIRYPTKYYKLIRSHLEKCIHGDERKQYISKIQHYSISFQGNLGSNFITPRGLSSRMSNQLVGIQGIITRMDIVKNQLEKSVHWCQKTKGYDVKQYPDSYAPDKQFQAEKTRFIRKVDENNNPLQFQYGLSSFRDIQQVVVQELPEMAPPGLLPQSVPVILQGGLVNKVKPGDRIQMIGIYKLVPGGQTKQKGIFKPYFLCLSIKSLHMSIPTTKMTAKMPCPQSQLFSLLSRSIAPSIYGHQQLKKAVLLMLLGGCQKTLDNGTHLRGDVNILMVGDPGTAKSQMLRWILSSVDLGIGTTGSGASGVGLTAAIVNDRQTGQKTLQAGAMVLADRGVVCIDQFDKMNEADRVSVHQVMEQQTVTIAKAGIHCSLNARCSVVAAANPIWGQYQSDKPPTKNIGMPDSLLSRFDLIFIILDQKNPDKDKRVAQRVLRNHRLAPISNAFNSRFTQQDDYVVQPVEPPSKLEQQTIFQKTAVFMSDSKTQLLTQNFLKKYINYCKANIQPVLEDDSITLLASLWTLLRQKDHQSKQLMHHKVLPITIRSYQTLIRLSTAHAKLRQSANIELYDCIQAFRLMIFCLYGSQDALNEELDQTLREHNLSVKLPSNSNIKLTNYNERMQNPQNRQYPIKNFKKQQESVIKGIQKIEIGKDQKQLDRMLRIQSERDEAAYKAKYSLVYKKRRQQFTTLKKLSQCLSKQKITQNEIIEFLKDLGAKGKVHFLENQQKIYL